MFRNYVGGVGGGTTQRIHAYLFDNELFRNIEVSWLGSTDRKFEEHELLEAYRQKFKILPKWNKR